MALGIRFEPETWYSEEELRISGIESELLARGRANGSLRFSKLTPRRRRYRGDWLNAWLEQHATPEVP